MCFLARRLLQFRTGRYHAGMNMQNSNFNGLRVGAFESRQAGQMERLITQCGGVAHVSPSVRITPLSENLEAVDFAHRLITGEVDIAIFLTGVGFELLLDIVGGHLQRQRYLDALADITTIARGSKTAAAMKRLGLKPTASVPPPQTWREVINLVDQSIPVDHRAVGLQAHGLVNHSLIAGLEARGAQVLSIPVYRWELPADTRLLEQNVRLLVQGDLDVLLFTAAPQVTGLLQVAKQLGLESRLVEAIGRTVVASVGPATSQMLRRHGMSVDLQPGQSRLAALVQLTAQRSDALLRSKRHIAAVVPGPDFEATDRAAPWYNGPFMKACRREPTSVTPIWLMRQAGRYMAEYRAVRKKVSFLELCKNPALCSEVMCTAVQRLGVDAAIIFSDLLPILEPMGLDLEFVRGTGPVIHNPLRQPGDVDRLIELENVDSLKFVMETVTQTRKDLPDHIPLIGFAGAPFTLASYAIEGGASRHYLRTKTLMYQDGGAWRMLMQRLARSTTRYLNAQIAAGAQCVQLFDSWVGCLGFDDYRRYVFPYVCDIVQQLKPGVPVINFATGNPALLPLLRETGSTVVGVDWRVRLDDAWKTLGEDSAVQGNLDPAVLLSDTDRIQSEAKAILDMAAGRPGHIFNLGHGVLPQTPVEHAIELVDAVHQLSSG